MKRDRQCDGDDNPPDAELEAQLARLEALKMELRRRGVEEVLQTIPSKLDSMQDLLNNTGTSTSVLRMELNGLVEIASSVRVWLQLSLPKIHEGDFAHDMINQMLLTFKALQASAMRLRDAIVPDLMAVVNCCFSFCFFFVHLKSREQGRVHEEVIKAADTDTKEAYQLALTTASARFAASAQKWVLDLRNCFVLLLDLMEKNLTSDAAFFAQVRPFGSRQAHHRMTASLEAGTPSRGSGKRGGGRRLLL